MSNIPLSRISLYSLFLNLFDTEMSLKSRQKVKILQGLTSVSRSTFFIVEFILWELHHIGAGTPGK